MELHDHTQPFERPPMTPEEYYAHLHSMIKRLKADLEWNSLSYFNRYQTQHLDDEFAKMMIPIIGKDLRNP